MVSIPGGGGEYAGERKHVHVHSCHPPDPSIATRPLFAAGCCSLQMSNILLVLPDFLVGKYGHILPSLEKALVSTADLLSLEAIDVAKRAQVPAGEVRKLTDALLEDLHRDVSRSRRRYGEDATDPVEGLKQDYSPGFISTLDESLDASLSGGIAPGYLTEVVGERYGFEIRQVFELRSSVFQCRRQDTVSSDSTAVRTTAATSWSRKASTLHIYGGPSTDNTSSSDSQDASSAYGSSR